MKTSVAVIDHLGSALAEAVSDLALNDDLVLLEKSRSSMAVRSLQRRRFTRGG